MGRAKKRAQRAADAVSEGITLEEFIATYEADSPEPVPIEPVRGAKKQTKAEREELRKRFLADAEAQSEKQCELKPEYDPIAVCCWERIRNSYLEAAWIETIHAYPNGLPYNEQTPLDLWLWQLAINANNRAVTKNAGRDRH